MIFKIWFGVPRMDYVLRASLFYLDRRKNADHQTNKKNFLSRPFSSPYRRQEQQQLRVIAAWIIITNIE